MSEPAKTSLTCPKCNAKLSCRQSLRRHLARKTLCVPVVEPEDLSEEKQKMPFKCKFCGRAYSTNPSMIRHIRTACKIAPRNGDTSGMEILYQHVTKKQEEKHKREMEEMMKRVELIEAAIKGTAVVPFGEERKTPATTIEQKNALVKTNKGMIDLSANKTVNTAIVNNVINVFGSENTAHITHADILRILQSMGPLGTDLRPVAEKVILQTAMLIHSDEKHPENITCYIPNKKGKDIMIHGKNGWETIPGSLALSPMALSAVDLLFEKQPYAGERGAPVDLEDITRLMKYLKDNEGSLVGDAAKPGSEFRAIPIRNKQILERLLPKLPVVGDA